jgi:TonB family protein
MSEVQKQWQGRVVSGEFHLRQYLGGSDHSAVFLTEYGHQRSEKAAIKLVPAFPGSAELQLARWETAAKLSHPQLIRLFQMGKCHLDEMSLLFVVMEYAEENLGQILPQRSLTELEEREMLGPVLDALQYLHSKGLVHGHLKPSNIMAVNDQVRLSSDGISAVGEFSTSLRKTGMYDPPESGNGAVSLAGDVWSLGVTLVESLTQHLPTGDKTGQGDPQLPQSMPAAFVDLARQCLCRDPQRRLSVAELKQRLASVATVRQEGLPAKPHKATPAWGYVAAAVVVVLAVVLLAVPALRERHPEAQRTASASESRMVEPARAKPSPASPGGPPHATAHPAAAGAGMPPAGDVAASSPPSRPVASSSSGRIKGGVAQQVIPAVPESARNTIQGTIRVNVRVRTDASGQVTDAAYDSPGPSKYFAGQAMQAARRWQFNPPQRDGQKVGGEWLLHFQFRQSGTTVVPVEITR